MSISFLSLDRLAIFFGLPYTTSDMAKMCIITKKRSVIGNNVSHSHRRTKRRIYPNLHKCRVLNPATGRMMMVQISAAGLRTLAKWDKAGKRYDLNDFVQ